MGGCLQKLEDSKLKITSPRGMPGHHIREFQGLSRGLMESRGQAGKAYQERKIILTFMKMLYSGIPAAASSS